MWSDIINLVAFTLAENNIGDSIKTKIERQIYCDKKSIKRTEFYQAAAVGLQPESVFEMRIIDYEGEKLLTYEGDEYNVIRSYSPSIETIELICSKTIEDIAIYLSALVVTTATISPVFAETTYTYIASVANGVESVTITPTCANATEITVESTRVESGEASSAIALSVGANVITVIMRKTARPTRTYTITITRAS